MRLGMAVDCKRCVGCMTCTISCKAENGTRPKIFWNRVIERDYTRAKEPWEADYADITTLSGEVYPNLPWIKRGFVRMSCMHCKEPACQKACPVGAISKKPDTDPVLGGAVLIDYAACVGCRRCEWACPYGAPQFNGNAEGYFPGAVDGVNAAGLTPYEAATYAGHKVGAVEKCTFCAHRLAVGKKPACVHNCPGRALTIGDLDDPTSEVSQWIIDKGGVPLYPEMGTEPSTYYCYLPFS